MKIKFNKERILRALFVAVSTVLIISCGIGVPGVLINISTGKANLPRGVVDIAKINPYGAEVIERENSYLTAVNAYIENSYATFGGMRTASRENDYANIGIQTAISDEYGLAKPEYMTRLVDIMSDRFFEGVPDRFYVSDAQSGDGNHALTYVFDDDSYALFDNVTGAPIEIHFVVRSEYECIPADLASSIASLYEDYIGVTFTTYDVTYSYSDGYRDSDTTIVFNSADGKFICEVMINSGWYFTPPLYNGDDWHETNLYEWTIDVAIYPL